MKYYMRLKGKLAALLALVLLLGEVNVPVTAWAAIDATDQAVVVEADTDLTGSIKDVGADSALEGSLDTDASADAVLENGIEIDSDADPDIDAVTDISAEADTVSADKMAFDENGMAKPVFKYSEIKDGYTNKDSEILRFAVYVETDFDTDKDGKTDLIQAVVQVPRAAAEGKYKAPTIYEASPYFGGTSEIIPSDKQKTVIPQPLYDPEFSETELYSQGERHTTSEPEITSVQLAERDNETDFSSNNWYYKYKWSNDHFISNLNHHDYFLIRGFAVVMSAGLGTNGSDGLSSCGSRAEVEAFKDVIEWINHKEGRKAYADRAGTIPINADWASGKVAMRGCSYNGTMAYEVAATGVDGLMTVVPEAGISSWYEYSNTQGVSHFDSNTYTTSLASSNSSRFFGLDTKADSFRSLCSKLFGYFDHSEEELAGHYGNFWTDREFSNVEAGKIKASALIVQGLNDYNVRTKQADLMKKAFERSGRDVRMILHQGGHETLEQIEIYSNPANPRESLDGLYYEDILNKWYCRYLCDKDNKIEDALPPVYAQNNTEEYFDSYTEWYEDSWISDSSKSITLSSGNANIVTLEKHNNPYSGSNDKSENIEPEMRSGDDPYFTIDDYFETIDCNGTGEGSEGKQYSETWIRRVPKEITIQGKAEIHIKAGVPEVPAKGRMVLGAMLYDVSSQSFPAYINSSGDQNVVDKEDKIKDFIDRGPGAGSWTLAKFMTTNVDKKLITKGMIDLGSPGAGYEPSTAVKGSVTAGNYYDYTIHMLPTVYTVKPGHYLWLYLIPVMDSIYSDVDVKIDNGSSIAKIPVSKIPEGFDELKTEYRNNVISDKKGETELSQRVIENEERIVTVSSSIWFTGLYPEYLYLGDPVQPEITLYDGTDQMMPDRDYTISYGSNNKPTDISGKDAVLTITFKGEYAATDKFQKTFKIAKANLSDNSEESNVYVSDTSVAYTGSALKPVPEIRYENEYGKVIGKNNFKFTYLKSGSEEPASSIKEAGKYTIIVEPSGPKSYFTGRMTAGLTVTESKNILLNNAKVEFNPASRVYTGDQIVPKTGEYNLLLKLDGRNYTTLVENEDYKLSFCRNNKNPGKAEAVFTAIPGNTKGLSGSVKGTFKIVKGRELLPSDKSSFRYNYQNYVPYSKSGSVPSWLEVYDGKNLLEKGRDYTVSFSNHKAHIDYENPNNIAHMTIKGKGLYKGTVPLDYTVITSNIGRMNVSVKDKTIPTRFSEKNKGYENPDIVITDENGKKLKKNVDYRISNYTLIDSNGNASSDPIDETKPAKIMLSIDGLNDYFGGLYPCYMYYEKANDLSRMSIGTKISDKTYTGSEIRLTADELNNLLVDTKSNGKHLVCDQDFFVDSYINNKNSGTATVVLKGKGIYGGNKIIKFKIKRQGSKKIL